MKFKFIIDNYKLRYREKKLKKQMLKTLTDRYLLRVNKLVSRDDFDGMHFGDVVILTDNTSEVFSIIENVYSKDTYNTLDKDPDLIDYTDYKLMLDAFLEFEMGIRYLEVPCPTSKYVGDDNIMKIVFVKNRRI